MQACQASAIIIAEQVPGDHPAAAGDTDDHLFLEGDCLGQGAGTGNNRSDHWHVADWSGMVIPAYVGGRSIEKVARIFKR